MSTPHPSGRGARLAMSEALTRGAIEAHDIDYINLHGTASLKNDEIEAQAVADLFPGGHPCQLDQGMDRSHAGRRGRAGSRDHIAEPRDRADAGQSQFAPARSGLRSAGAADQCHRRGSPCDEQLIRFWRQQLCAGVCRGQCAGRAMTGLLAQPARLYVNGVGLWSSRLPGWERACKILAGEEAAPTEAAPRPAPELLPPTRTATRTRHGGRGPRGRALGLQIRAACAGLLALRVHFHARRSRHHRLHVRHHGVDAGLGLADPFSQLGAQRGRGLLDHCGRVHASLHPPCRPVISHSAQVCSKLACRRWPAGRTSCSWLTTSTRAGPLAPVARSKHLLAAALGHLTAARRAGAGAVRSPAAGAWRPGGQPGAPTERRSGGGKFHRTLPAASGGTGPWWLSRTAVPRHPRRSALRSSCGRHEARRRGHRRWRSGGTHAGAAAARAPAVAFNHRARARPASGAGGGPQGGRIHGGDRR